MEEIVPISKFKATCLSLLDKVNKTGQPILVTKKGSPLPRWSPSQTEKAGLLVGIFPVYRANKGDIVSPVVSETDWEALK